MIDRLTGVRRRMGLCRAAPSDTDVSDVQSSLVSDGRRRRRRGPVVAGDTLNRSVRREGARRRWLRRVFPRRPHVRRSGRHHRSVERTAPPSAVRLELRREVGFCCPVEGCHWPYLTWHHFDPPWHARQHHDQAGMVALCLQHHKEADSSAFTPEQLHAFKTTAVRDPPIGRSIGSESNSSSEPEAGCISDAGCFSKWRVVR